MPNRILKESIRTSKTINELTDFQFRVWAYLITYVDDYGRGSAEPDIIKGFVFPRRKSITEATIKSALLDLANIGLIRLYEIDGDSYLCLRNWEKHQKPRAATSKYPAPPEENSICLQMQADVCRCSQVPADAPDTRYSIFDTRYPIPDTRSSSSVFDAREDGDVDLGSDWVRFVKVYEANIGSMPTSEVECADLHMFFDEFGADAMCEIVREVARKHTDNPHRYFAVVCRKWLGKGIRTAEQVKAAFMDYARANNAGNRSGRGGGDAEYAKPEDFF